MSKAKVWPVRVLNNLFGFLFFICTGFGLFSALVSRRKNPNEVHEVILHSFHTGIYLWLWIAAGFLMAQIVDWGASSTIMGWLYLCIVGYTLLTILFDISRNVMLILAISVGFLWVSALYLQDQKNILILSTLYDYLAGLKVQLDPGFARATSWMLLIPFVCVLIQAYFDGRIRITANEIEIYHYGKMTDSISRVGKRIRENFRDLNETVLGIGAADLVVIDYNGNVERRMENIVGLRFQMAQIDKILEVWDTRIADAKTNDVMVQKH